MYLSFFFFNDTATTEIYTLSLHDALPISWVDSRQLINACNRQACLYGLNDCEYYLVSWMYERQLDPFNVFCCRMRQQICICEDRKSTRLNSSHANISYAVFCLKKKKST